MEKGNFFFSWNEKLFIFFHSSQLGESEFFYIFIGNC